MHDPVQATTAALRAIASRVVALTEEITQASTQLQTLVAQAAPRTTALLGISTEHAGQLLATAGDHPHRLRSEAAFAALCGASPIPASSGKTHRHRLNPGGDRAANRALHMIAVVRMRWCPILVWLMATGTEIRRRSRDECSPALSATSRTALEM